MASAPGARAAASSVGVADHRRLAEEGVAAAMVRMEMRADDEVDIVGSRPTAGRLVEHVVAGRRSSASSSWRGRPSAPPRSPALGDRGMTAGVEQHVALIVAIRSAETGSSIISPRSALGTKMFFRMRGGRRRGRASSCAPPAAVGRAARTASTMCW